MGSLYGDYIDLAQEEGVTERQSRQPDGRVFLRGNFTFLIHGDDVQIYSNKSHFLVTLSTILILFFFLIEWSPWKPDVVTDGIETAFQGDLNLRKR